MKKTILTIIAALMFFSVSYAEKEKKVKSKVKNVTVYLQGAQVKRKGSFKLQSGVTKIIFEGMSKTLDKNSIQVKGKGDFIILDVSSDLFYPEPKPVVSSISSTILRKKRLLKDSIERQQWINRATNDQLSAYQLEKEILMGSLVIKGQTTNDSIVALKDAMEYLREKLIELNPLISEYSRKKQKQDQLLNGMNQRLRELEQYIQNLQQKPQRSQPIQQVIVTVSADREVSGSLELDYMVPGASWSPSYDLRADDINSPVELTYKANVYQNTGEDWENVSIKLSTINPNRSNYKPSLATWYLNYYRPIARTDNYGYGSNLSNAKEMSSIDKDYELNDEIPMVLAEANNKKLEAKHMNNFTQMSENIIMTEFELKLPYTIPSDGKPHMMAVGKEEIDAAYEHYIVPKLDKDAFLLARLTDWEELNLLPGVANIYYDGSYVGQTRINPAVMSDTLDLALGRDRGIFVTRKKLNDDEKLRAFTNEKLRTITYEISLKNFKSTDIHVKIEDHIPVPQDQEIKVELVENETADYNKDTGILKWDKSIEGKETVKYLFTYTIKYNKDKTLAVN
jgi:uncharacterized protein (TIGR02231 family)